MDTSNTTNKILIVEDHSATRKLLQGILGSEYQVLVASDGQTALELARETPAIDLILLDILMPGINGYEVCQTLKNDARTREIPVIFLTMLEDAHDEARGFAMGVVDYIIKPISRLRLQARVRNQLVLRQKQRELEQKNRELQAALDQIKTLHGILPICSFCKRIRNDKEGCWQPLEEYIQNHSDAEFSHSLCPQCMKEHYPEYCQEDPPPHD